MYRSHRLQRMVSTSHGQRRILKKSTPVAKYIRQAVESGTYPPESDPAKRQASERKAPYGSNFRDYPIEYEILTLHPPIPPPPRIPKKQRGMRQKASHVPTSKLVKDFLQRQPHAPNLTTDEYYARLLGIPPPTTQTAMGKKSAVLNKAYAFALRQYQIMRQDDNITEEESIEMVNKLLKEEKKDERYNSRTTATEIQQWRHDYKQSEASPPSFSTVSFSANDASDEKFQDSSSYPSILHSKPRAIEGMALWSQRLKAVPYREWTIGASTALDHWIARTILEMEEDTWQALLEGETPELVSQGADIIAVRQSLFPETMLHATRRDGILVEEEEEQEEESSKSLQDKSIDELLASLGAFDDDLNDSEESDASKFFPSSSVVDEDNLDSKVAGLVDDLQRWRQKNVESPYEQWSTDEKHEFASWLDTYVSTLSSKRDGEVDLIATRKALLESPPIDKEESVKFWQQVRDETEAEILLQSIRKTDAPSHDDAVTTGDRKAREAFAHFLNLPYHVQLQKLVDLGTLRPLMDEYTSESERVKFLARYGEKLMEGVLMEHLVPDPDGPVRGAELGRWGEENGIEGEERFRMETVPYGSDEFGSDKSVRAREMYRAWNTHKAGRARFEEIMFKKDRLGLRYNLDDKGKVQTTTQGELNDK